MNTAAKSLLALNDGQPEDFFAAFKCKSKEEAAWMLEKIVTQGSIDNFPLCLQELGGDDFTVLIRGNMIEISGNKLIALYFEKTDKQKARDNRGVHLLLNKLLYMYSHSENSEQAINMIIGAIGDFIDLSRVYIFESSRDDVSNNTYEWVNSDLVLPVKNSKEAAFGWIDIAYAHGILLSDDIRMLGKSDRQVLEVQGIKSIVIFPLHTKGKAIGYIGFDDCQKYRKWSASDIQMMRNTADIVAGLILRKQTERNVAKSHEMMRTILDSMDSLMYVMDFTTKKVLFANRSLKEKIGCKPQDEVEGKRSWELLADFECSEPLKQLELDEQGRPTGSLRREYYNKLTGLWYYSVAYAIEWIDGQQVMLESLLEFTEHKENEQELEKYASLDLMTGVYNREWGSRLLRQMLLKACEECDTVTVCFFDVDKLKYVNDTYGHLEGDNLLRSVVEITRQKVRSTDLLYRWGGDEFVLAMPQCTLKRAKLVVKQIVAEFEKINNGSQFSYKLSCSYGLKEILPGDEIELEALIGAMDCSMYDNKSGKK